MGGLSIVYNDLTAHSLGEYYFGTGQGVARFMCLAIGTGLGAGVIVRWQAANHRWRQLRQYWADHP